MLGHAAAALRRGHRTHCDLRARARQALDLGVVHAERVREHHVRPEHADRLEVFGRGLTVARLIVLARLRPAAVVKRQKRVVLVGHALDRAQQIGAARLRRERHGPRPDPAVEPSLPLAEERGRAVDGVARGVAGQGERSLLIRHALDEADRAALQELHEPQQGRGVLLLFGHRHLQLEHVAERAREVVGEDPADRVGVADVHVTVDEAGRHEQMARVDHPLGLGVRQRGRLAHPTHLAVLDEDRAVLDDSPLAVDGDDVAGVVDLEAPGRHRASYGGAITGPGTAGGAFPRRP